MRTLITLTNGKRQVKVEVDLHVETLCEVIREKRFFEITKDEFVNEYRDNGYFIKGIEDIDKL